MGTSKLQTCLVTVGSTRNDFKRLIHAVDRLCEDRRLGGTFAQIGTSSYVPRHMTFERFVPRTELLARVGSCDLVICHAGTGTLNAALGLRRKVIVVPRRAALGEHPDDHQLELAAYLESRGRALVVNEVEELAEAVVHATWWVPAERPPSRNGVLALIEEYGCRYLSR